MPKVAVYLRVSTQDQSAESQRVELAEYCVRRGWENPTWHEDTASGASRSREGLDRMLAAVRAGKVDVAVCYKLDRLARSLSHLAQILGELETHKVALVCPSQGIDTTHTNPAAQLQVNILAAVAQFERELITERVNAGLRAARERGAKLGRPAKHTAVYGMVRSLVLAGENAAAISRKAGLPSSSARELVREIKESLVGLSAAA